MLGLRPWLAFLVRALCFFFWVRLDMRETLPVGAGVAPTGTARVRWSPVSWPAPALPRRVPLCRPIRPNSTT